MGLADLVTLTSMHCEPVLAPGASPITAVVDEAPAAPAVAPYALEVATWIPLTPPVTTVDAVAAEVTTRPPPPPPPGPC